MATVSPEEARKWSIQRIAPSVTTAKFFEWHFTNSGHANYYIAQLCIKEGFPLYLYFEDGVDATSQFYVPKFIYSEQGYLAHGLLPIRGLINEEVSEQAARGLVLDSMCEIEFIVNVLVCHLEGVYSTAGRYRTIQDEWNEGGRFASLEKRLNILRKSKVISRKTFDTLKLAKGIRDTLAHQFIPREYGINDKILGRYGGRNGTSHLKATGDCINLAWLNLLSDLSKVQDEIIIGILPD